jgi:hypothetical protein
MINVRVVDSTGRTLPNVGRHGQGPGEFQFVGSFGFLGDSLWVFDPFMKRLTYFWNNGQAVDTRPLQPPSQATSERRTILLSDGSMIWLAPHLSKLSETVGADTFTIVRLVSQQRTSSGDSIGVLTRPRSFYFPLGFTEDNRRRVTVTHPWPMEDKLVASSNGSELVLVHPIDGVGYTVTARNTRRVVFDVTVREEPVPAPNARLSAWAKDLASGPYKPQAQRMGMEVEKLASAMRESAENTKYLSPTSGGYVAANGYVWIAREQRWPEGAVPTASDSLRMDVFDATGKRVAYVVLPGSCRVLAVTNDRIWGIEQDVDEGRRIVRYHVTRRS